MMFLQPDFTLLQQLPRLLKKLISRAAASFSPAAASPDWKVKVDFRFCNARPVSDLLFFGISPPPSSVDLPFLEFRSTRRQPTKRLH